MNLCRVGKSDYAVVTTIPAVQVLVSRCARLGLLHHDSLEKQVSVELQLSVDLIF